MSDRNKGGGLAGVTAGETAIATVGKEGAGLTYRGYDIYDLAENARFEEVAFLLHHGHLPNAAELDGYVDRLRGMRGLPAELRDVLVEAAADEGEDDPAGVLRGGRHRHAPHRQGVVHGEGAEILSRRGCRGQDQEEQA